MDPPEETKRGPGRPRKIADDGQKPNTASEAVKFRTTYVGLVHFPDGTTFPFNKPILTFTNPDLIAKLDEIASRPKTNIFRIE